jgi:hypothetical protein
VTEPCLAAAQCTTKFWLIQKGNGQGSFTSNIPANSTNIPGTSFVNLNSLSGWLLSRVRTIYIRWSEKWVILTGQVNRVVRWELVTTHQHPASLAVDGPITPTRKLPSSSLTPRLWHGLISHQADLVSKLLQLADIPPPSDPSFSTDTAFWSNR